jgi:formylglycine-generating enzyme required for sulfatase activity/fibronectin type 3 domain-containing protein/PKD repeat protein
VRFSSRALALSGAVVLLAAAASATSIVPPRNLGELAKTSDAVVLGEAIHSRVVQRGSLLFTETTFLVEERVKWAVAASAAGKGGAPRLDTVTVLAPGGELDGAGWAVPGSPRFVVGEQYLLMLDLREPELWQPHLFSYGLLKRMTGRDGNELLAPIDETYEVQGFPRPDGIVPEPLGTYRKDDLVRHLRAVTGGEMLWRAAAVLAAPAQAPPAVSAQSVPAGCAFFQDSSSRNVRWNKWDSNPSAQLAISADPPTGDASYSGSITALQDALGIWNGTSSTINVSYAGAVSTSMSCTSGTDVLPDTVVFNDPCSDMSGITSGNCSGKALGFGGPMWFGTHQFDGATWATAVNWVVVMNDGAGTCVAASDYKLMLAHELGHGLGFDHVTDPNAMMYPYCCNNLDSTDTTCAGYAYPPSGPQPPPAPTGVAASDGTYTDHVRVGWNASSGATSYKVFRNTTNSSGSATQIGTPGASPYDDFLATPGTIYYYWVKATNANGDSTSFGGPDTGFAAAIPAAPTGVTASDGTYTDHVAVSWNAVSGATSYKVFRNTVNNSGSASQISTPSGTGFDDSTAVAGTTYYYWVKSSNVAGDSVAFGGPDTGFARLCSTPPSPTASAPPVAGSGQSYIVSWTATSPPNSYEIQEATNSGFSGATTYGVTGTQRTFSHTVGGSTTYYYRVRASDCALWSAYSLTVTTNVVLCGTPAVPVLTAPAAADSGATYSVTWTATSPDNSYQLDEATNGAFTGATTYPLTGTGRTFSHTVGAQSTFFYRVRAIDSCGASTYYSAYSTGGTTVVSPCTTPAAPTIAAPASVPAGQSYTVSWSATSPDNSYQLDEATNAGFVSPTTFAVTGTSKLLSHSPAADTTYYSRVRAVDTCAGTPYYSPYSAPGSTLVTVCTQPAAPALSSPGAGATVPGPSVTLTWGAVAGATSYDVYFAAGAVPGFVANVAGTGYAVAISNGQSYSWKVVAKNACGQGESEVRDFSVCSAPASPLANFTWSPQGTAAGFPAQQQPFAGQVVQLTDLSTNSPTAWSWYDFQGVGIHYTVQNPTHTWTSSGSKNVRLVASNCAGSSAEKLIQVTVYPDIRTVTADFSWSPSPPTKAIPITFTAAQGYAYGDPTQFTWKFKDNNATASGASATHTFSCGGWYDVVLTAKRGSTQGTSTKSVTVGGQPCCDAPGIPVANFVASPLGPLPAYPQQLQPYVGQQVTLTDTSTNLPTSWTWTGLPAGSVTTDQSPTAVWTAAGTYAVGLTAANCAGPSTPRSAQVTVFPDIRPVARRFDFGTTASPVAAGFTRVAQTTTYTPAAGYGWLSGTVDSRNRSAGNDLTRDLDFTALGTFAVDVPAGIYDVTVTSGDASSGHDQMGVSLEGAQVDSLTTPANQWISRTYQVAVLDGQLTVQLQDLGGVDKNAVINALTVATAPTKRFDFGIAGSPPAPNWVAVPSTLRYAASRGWGWLTGAVSGRDRAIGTALTRDLNFSTLATFAVDVPNGDYDVTVRLGDMSAAHDQVGVFLEGAWAETVSTLSGQIAVRTYRTTVADGQLSLLLDDLGGSDVNAAIVGLEVATVLPPTISVTLPGDVLLDLRRIPAGTFAMGSPDSERGRVTDEGPPHTVTLSQAYYVGRTEVTQAQWQAIMGSNPATGAGIDPALPVYNVSWSDIAGPGGFLENLNAHLAATGQVGAGLLRLPTEAEWENAARGGTSTRFPFGDALGCDDFCGACAVSATAMWWCGNAGTANHAVGSLAPNRFGLADTQGNVWEWVTDWWAPYAATAQIDPLGPASGSYRVQRGGDSFGTAADCRAARREYQAPGVRNGNVGFRVARGE